MFTFPAWLQDFQVQDDIFAEAYEATMPQQRAWLKKTIAQVYAVNSPDRPLKTWNVSSWRGGFETEISTSPIDWTLMLLDEASLSPVRILAALAPALAAGVKNIHVTYIGEGAIPRSVLTAFELAGQEDVAVIPPEKLDELMQDLSCLNASGAVLDLRGTGEALPYYHNMRYWRVPEISSISVCKDEDSPDMDVLAFAHPDVDFVELDEDSFEEAESAAVVVPAELVGEALLNFRIVIAHGQEGCWLWNDFDSSFFRQESVALAVSE